MIRNLAVACCFALMAFGAVLILLDARAAVTLSAEEWTRTMAQSLALWRWGVVCVISGVLGMVGVALINAMVTARLWLARERRKESKP